MEKMISITKETKNPINIFFFPVSFPRNPVYKKYANAEIIMTADHPLLAEAMFIIIPPTIMYKTEDTATKITPTIFETVFILLKINF